MKKLFILIPLLFSMALIGCADTSNYIDPQSCTTIEQQADHLLSAVIGLDNAQIYRIGCPEITGCQCDCSCSRRLERKLNYLNNFLTPQ